MIMQTGRGPRIVAACTGAILAAAIALVPKMAHAANAPGTSSPDNLVTAGPAPARPLGPEEIVVTGSRIKAAPALAAEPVTTISAGQVFERNRSHFADALQQLPGVRGSVTPDGPQAEMGQGANYLNVFGLGSNRTLTLVNGKRMVSSNGPSLYNAARPGSQVDLNAIPTILLNRVEILSIGGAPAYGSDAIAATVNVVLDRRLTGLKFRALSGISNQGDNFRQGLAAAGGQDFAGGRGNVTFALGYDTADGVASRARSLQPQCRFGPQSMHDICAGAVLSVRHSGDARPREPHARQ